MMRILVVGVVVSGILLSVATPSRLPQTSSPCGQDTVAMRGWLRHIAVLNDSSGTAWRQRIGLSALDSGLVTSVADTTMCRAALNAYNAALVQDLPGSAPSVVVDVVKYGTLRYVVADSARRSSTSEWIPTVVFNNLFTQVIAKTGM